jgi:hypothetical protein
MAAVATRVPDSVAHLDLTTVAEVLVKHGANVRSAASELGVPTSDLRQLTLVNQTLINAAYEAEELRLDRAEAVVDEALRSDDSRRKDAAAYFILRNSSRGRKRGWITSSSSVDLNFSASANNQSRPLTFRWRNDSDPDPHAADWVEPASGPLLEHEPTPAAED